YADWIRRTIVENSTAGDDVLAVVHLALLQTHGFFAHEDGRRSNTPDRHLDIEGRRVNFIHFGCDVGVNKWAHKTTVIVFGDFILPKSISAATTFGYADRKVDAGTLRLASNPKRPLEASHALIHAGHTLRWHKQLPCRGSVRNIVDGLAGRMKLV